MKYLMFFTLIACATQKPSSVSRNISATQKWESHFQDVTFSSGVDPAHSLTIVMGDFNKDLKVDFIANKRLYLNTSTRTDVSFKDVTSELGLSLEGSPMFMDVNNDSWPDIVTTKGQIYIRKVNGGFKESSKQFGLNLPGDVHTLAFGDLNKDGYPDLIVGRTELYQDNKFNFVPPKVYFNQKGMTFKDMSHLYNMEKYPAYVRGVHIADYNNDSVPDIYFSNYRLRQNFLLNGQKDLAPMAGVQGELDRDRTYDEHLKKKFGPQYGHTIGSVWADLNNDGNLDLFVSNLVHKYVGPNKSGGYDYRGYVCDDSKVYKNMGAPHYKFQDMRQTSELPVMPIGGSGVYKGDELWAHATAADFDNDGLLDFYVSQVYNLHYAKAKLFKNKGNFKFKDVSSWTPELIDSYAAAWGDLNNDGKPDLIVSGREKVGATPQLKVLLNIHETKNNYLKVKLIGTKSGTVPVATQVRLFHEKGVFLRQVEGVTGTMNQQNDPYLHFGLGSVDKIKKVEVRWSSGRKQVLSVRRVNTTLEIMEPSHD